MDDHVAIMTECDRFGVQLRKDQFSHHDPSLTRLNNGSFGACPKVVLEYQNMEKSKWLANPDDTWYRLKSQFDEMSLSVARTILGDESLADDVFMVDNLTVAFAAVAQSMLSTIEDDNAVVVMTNITYNAVQKAVRHALDIASSHLGEGKRVSVLTVEIPFPIYAADGDQADEIILDAYRSGLNKMVESGKRPMVAMVDHISSLPSMVMPIHRIVALLREYGVEEIVVDGAHTPGQLDISYLLSQLGCDVYMANLHKWAFAPTSAAFMWVSPSCPSRDKFHHPIISHCSGMGFKAEVAMLGTRDYSAILAVSAGLAFLESLGGVVAVSRKNASLCAQALHMLAKAWDVESCVPYNHPSASMGMIGCPAILGDSEEDSDTLRLALRERNIVIQRLVPVAGDRLYLRISCAVYNDLCEYEILRDAVLDLVAARMTSS